MLHDAMQLADEGPVAIRYPTGAARQVGEHEVGVGPARPAGARGRRHRVCILADRQDGRRRREGRRRRSPRRASTVTVWDVRCCAPLDPAMIADAARHAAVITVEDGVRDGGIGMTIADRRARARRRPCRSTVLGLPTQFIPQGKPDRILARLGLDADGIGRCRPHSP